MLNSVKANLGAFISDEHSGQVSLKFDKSKFPIYSFEQK